MHQNLRILHLEDLPTDAELIERVLLKSDLVFEKIVVDNRKAYINALENFHPDIVLSDHSLPSFNSKQALEILKEGQYDIPFILITATISEEFAVEIIKHGAADYILKDRPQRLPSAIKTALEINRLEKEKQRFITELIASEKLMKEAEQMAHFGSFSLDNLTNIVKWSDECYRILGYKPGETEPSFTKFLESVHPADRDFYRQTVYNSAAEQNFLKINYRLGKGDEIKYIHSELALKRGELGQPVLIKGFMHDVTEMKTTEYSLHKSEANLSTIFSNTDTAYILFTPNQQIVSFNYQANVFSAELFGAELKEGNYAKGYFSEKRMPFINDAFSRAVNGENTSYETSFLSQEGIVKWYNSRWLGIVDANKSNLGVILAISDITERKTIEIEREKIANDLIKRNSALEQFAFIVSHNLRAPVANIIALTDAITTWGDGTDGKQDFLNGLAASATKLDEVVLDMNHILRISQRTNEQRGMVYFEQLVNDVTLGLGNRIPAESVVLKTNFTQAQSIYTLKSYLYNIFYTLIVNSYCYRQMFVPPVIEITSIPGNQCTKIVFKDNGKGIDLAKHGKKLFGLYQRFDTTVEGRGMGLCMAKTQIETLGGKISIESEVNKGTIFTVELPT